MYPADIRHKDEGRSLGGPRWEHTCQLSESGWLRQTRIDPRRGRASRSCSWILPSSGQLEQKGDPFQVEQYNV